MKINPKQLTAVVALPAEKRFEHFVKVVADWQEVWGLYKDGWALAADDDGKEVFPLWPAKEYAALCKENEWGDYEPKSIGLNEFMSELLPKLKRDGVLPGVFFVPAGKGVTPSIAELEAALEAELSKY